MPANNTATTKALAHFNAQRLTDKTTPLAILYGSAGDYSFTLPTSAITISEYHRTICAKHSDANPSFILATSDHRSIYKLALARGAITTLKAIIINL